MLGAALRFAVGTATVAASGWVLRALQGSPTAVGARPDEIWPVARRSPNYRDGVFVNIDPAASMNLDSEQRSLLIRELIGSRDATRPPTADPAGRAAEGRDHAAGPRGQLVRPLLGADRGRRLPRARPTRCGAGAARRRGRSAPSGCTRCRCRWRRCPRWMRCSSATTTTTTSTSTRSSRWRTASARRSSCRWESVRTCASGESPTDRIVELDWHESHRIGDLTLVCTPARHFSGRLLTRNTTLWASWVIIGPRHRAFFGGDTGYTKSFAEIGMDHGPFDLTLLPVGAYHPALAGHPHEPRRSGAGPPRHRRSR